MTRFINLQIRTQLLILAALLILPALGITVYSGLNVRSDDYLKAAIESQRLTDNIAAELQDQVHEAELLAGVLSDLPDVKNRNIDHVQSILLKSVKRYPQYSDIFITDESGTIWASTSPLPTNTSLADRRYFKNVKATKRFSSGEFVISKSRKNPAIHLAFPLLDKSLFLGAVIIGFNLVELRDNLERAQLLPSTNYIVADHKGIIVSRGRNIGQDVGKPIMPAELKKMENGPDKDTYEFILRGDRRIVTYQKVKLEGEQTPFLYVRGGLSIKEAVSKANVNLFYNVSLLLSFVLAACVLTYIIGKRSIVDRINLLKQASQKLASGGLDFKVSDSISGGELGDLGQSFDDMSQKLAYREQALRESKNNYRDIFNTTHDALFVNDASGVIIEANKSAEIMFGYTREELLHLSVADLMSGEPPYSLPEALILMEKALNEGTQKFEWLSRRKNGAQFWTEIAITPTNVFGKRRVLAVISDITERKEMEHLKGEMLSTISHEMRTPLSAMLGFLDFVIENKVDAALMHEYHIIMHKEGERLNEMITNFLDMQRLKAKLHEYNFKPLEVRPLLEEAVAIFANPSAKHSIIVAAPATLPPISGDDELLHQVVSNLLSNAIKYSPEGSEVILDARLDNNNVTLWVKDEGIGIPPESLDKIFDMFYRVDNTAKLKTVGTGLGLALVKEIVSAHNGKVWVESRLGQGSTFYISLPVVSDDNCKAPEV